MFFVPKFEIPCDFLLFVLMKPFLRINHSVTLSAEYIAVQCFVHCDPLESAINDYWKQVSIVIMHPPIY